MTESIYIENLGPLARIEISNIKKLTLLMGPSGSGKSTLMKVVALFRYLYKMSAIRSYFHSSQVRRSPFRVDFRSLLKQNGMADLFSAETYVRYAVRSASGCEYQIVYSKGRGASGLEALPHINTDDLVFEKGAYICDNRTVISQLGGRRADTKALGLYFNETQALFEEAMEVLGDIDLGYFDMRLARRKASNSVKYVLSPGSGGKSFELRQGASGILSTTPLGVIAFYLATKFSFKDAFQRSVIDYLFQSDRLQKFKPVLEFNQMRRRVDMHVEEPELSLDPDSQLRLMRFLVDTSFRRTADDREVTMMMASHSPYIASMMNLFLAESDQGSGGVPADSLAVYELQPEGTMRDCVVRDESGRWIVDTDFMTSRFETIYDSYDSLRPE